MVKWSTDTIKERERFSFWRDAVCQSVFNISIEAAPKRFSARISARNSGSLRFATSESSAYRIVRSRRDIASAPADHYSIYLQVRGETVIDQCGDSFLFRPNDIAISDGLQPFQASLSEGGRRTIGVIPRSMIDQRAPWIRQKPLRKLESNSPFVDLARRHLLELAHDEAMNDNATTLMTDNLCNLLALASANDLAVARMEPELQAEAMITFCRQNLHDSQLTPQLVASHFCVSLRTLHLRFEKLGQTFGRWLLENRLDATSTTLRDPYQRSCSVSEIAYRWGFNDLSHFNKSFRARFGMPPTQWRMQCKD